MVMMMKQGGGRLDNRIQKFNQKERAGIRLAWYVVSPRPVKMSAMVRGVVQCTSVWWSSVARSRSWQLQTLQSIPANPWTSPLGLLCSPPHQSSKGPSQEGQSDKLVQNRGGHFKILANSRAPENMLDIKSTQESN